MVSRFRHDFDQMLATCHNTEVGDFYADFNVDFNPVYNMISAVSSSSLVALFMFSRELIFANFGIHFLYHPTIHTFVHLEG